MVVVGVCAVQAIALCVDVERMAFTQEAVAVALQRLVLRSIVSMRVACAQRVSANGRRIDE